MTLDDRDFEYVFALVRTQSGTVLDAGKEYLVESRLGPVAKQAGCDSLVELVSRLRNRPNDDLHLKNFSVQRLPDNTSPYYDKLTPNYDCLFCDAFNDEEKGMGLLALGLLHDAEDDGEYFTDMYSHYGYYTGYDFLELGRRLGLQEKPIRTFITKLKTNQKKITDQQGILH